MFCFFICSAILGATLYAFSKIDASILLAIYDKYRPNKKRLANSTVWIVGSSSGIGEALAYEFVELNCRLILTATTKSRLDEVKRKCLNLNSKYKDDDILVLPFDVSDLKANRDALRTVLDKFGDIDILIGNAGRAGVEDSLSGIDDELEIQRKTFDINYFGNIYLAKLVASHWEKTNSTGLKILAATSSVAAISSSIPFYQAYCASKMSLNSYYRDLKLQYPKIQCATCMPGPVVSEIGEKSLSKVKITNDEQKRMSAERCADLYVTALANNLSEFIICEQWVLMACYISIYLNFEVYSLMRLFNVGNLFRKKFNSGQM